MLGTSRKLRYITVGDVYYLTTARDGRPLTLIPTYLGRECKMHGQSVARKLVVEGIIRMILQTILMCFALGLLIYNFPVVLLRALLVFLLVFIFAYAIYSIVDLQLEDRDGNCINLTQNVIVVGNVPIRLVE